MDGLKWLVLADSSSSNNVKLLWSNLNFSLGRSKDRLLPEHQDNHQLACEFNAFFKEKVAQIKDELLSATESSSQIHSNTSSSNTSVPPQSNGSSTFVSFAPVSENEVKKIIMNCPNKSSSLDIIPTWVLKRCLQSMLPVITLLINRSFECGMPTKYKHALVTPIYKKGSTDKNSMSSYRPVSNLTFFSKLIERAVSTRIVQYLNENSLNDPQQFAYNKYHSCESALTVVLDAAFHAADCGQVTLLVLLDLSAAFDTVDHNILVSILDGIGFKDGALRWLKDYLKDRTNTVKCSDSTSSEVSLDVGVPQGSVLGPLLFTIYLKEVGSVILQHNVRYIAYADDIQLFVHVHPSQIEVATSQLQDCIADLQSWLRSRQLKMNPRKTEFIVLGRRVMISKVYAQPPKLLINNHEIVAKSSVRDLGLIIDSCLTMEPQANNACRIAFLYLRNISRHRIYLDKHATKMLVNAFVLGRIFYCSSLPSGKNFENAPKFKSSPQNNGISTGFLKQMLFGYSAYSKYLSKYNYKI
jgi:hypothetical protein